MDGDEFSNVDLFLSALKDQVHTNVLSSTQIEPGPSDLPQHDISDIAVEDAVLADISYTVECPYKGSPYKGNFCDFGKSFGCPYKGNFENQKSI